MKKKKVKPIPDGYHSVTPYLSIRGASEAIDFYKKALGAKEVMRMPGPATRGGTTVHLHVYVPDVDKVVAKALTAGARLVRPIKDQFYGDRLGTVEDPFGHVWHLATHKEDLSMKELKKRAEKAASGE